MEDHSLTTRDIADIIGDNVGSVSLKLQGVIEWTLSEAVLLCHHFDYSDVRKLFLRLDYKY
jgi:hypothetical protein